MEQNSPDKGLDEVSDPSLKYPEPERQEILEGLTAWVADSTVLDHRQKLYRGDLTSDSFKLQSQGNHC